MVNTPLAPDLKNDRVFGQISVGRATYLGAVQFKVFIPSERIYIGRYTSIADDVLITAGGNHRTDLPSTWPFDNFLLHRPNPSRTYRELQHATSIGSDVWIGNKAIVGGGVTIGHGAVVGAGAVVYRDVPPYAIVVGNPARVIRTRFTAEQIERLLQSSWWDWSPDLIEERIEWFYLDVDNFIKEAEGKII